MKALYHQSLAEGIVILCVQYCWFCSMELGYRLWKHWRPCRSVKIVNMHKNQYLFDSEKRKKIEEQEKTKPFFCVLYMLFIPAQQMRRRTRLCPDQQIIYSSFSICPCGVYNCKWRLVRLYYLSLQVCKGGMGAVFNIGAFVYLLL